MVGLIASTSRGQWTIDFNVDEANALAALRVQERLPPMYASLERVKSRLERILAGSTGAVVITLTWADPMLGNAIGSATTSQVYLATAAVGRDRLINRAEADNEPVAETNLYEALPTPGIAFLYSGETSVSASSLSIPSALNKHLGFAPHTTPTDGTIRVKPPSVPPDTTLRWQFFKGPLIAGHELFEALVFHECLHLFGFSSTADQPFQPTVLTTWDAFRFSEATVPASTGQFQLIARELRPTVEAVALTRIGTTHPLSRGTRTGGDTFQASHWRASTRLTPANPVGVMDPAPTTSVTYTGLMNSFYTRADMEALDIMGWNLNPDSLQYSSTAPIQQIAPEAEAILALDAPVAFEWTASDVHTYTLYVYAGLEVVDDHPLLVADGLTGTSHDVPAGTLPPGQYTWYVVGEFDAGIVSTGQRHFTIGTACPADFNGDGLVDSDDLGDFINCYFEETSNPGACPAADFDGSGATDADDLGDFINTYFTGC